MSGTDEKELEQAHFESPKGEEAELTELDPALDLRLTRKFDLHIVPWLFGLWLLAFIDRSNIGNAKIDGLTEDLHLTGNEYNSALAIFYVPYILIDVPSNWFVKVRGPNCPLLGTGSLMRDSTSVPELTCQH